LSLFLPLCAFALAIGFVSLIFRRDVMPFGMFTVIIMSVVYSLTLTHWDSGLIFAFALMLIRSFVASLPGLLLTGSSEMRT